MTGKNIKTNTAMNSPCWLCLKYGRIPEMNINSRNAISCLDVLSDTQPAF